jgi:hypothetical protein
VAVSPEIGGARRETAAELAGDGQIGITGSISHGKNC